MAMVASAPVAAMPRARTAEMKSREKSIVIDRLGVILKHTLVVVDKIGCRVLVL